METSALAVVVQIGLIWIGYRWLLRDLLVDRFRQRLFSLRGELFDLAATDPGLRFEDTAYGMLRTSLNGCIRFAHRIDVVDVLLCLQSSKSKDDQQAFEAFRDRWARAVAELPKSSQEKLANIRGRMHYATIGLVVSTSLVLTVVALVATMLVLGFELARWAVRRTGYAVSRMGTSFALSRVVRSILGNATVDRLANALDCSAEAEMERVA